jgi:hypothetical protein
MHLWKSWLGVVACLALVVWAAPARAMQIRPPSLPEKVAGSQLVVTGKVTGFGPKMVKAELFANDKREMQIAIVKVDDALLGKAGKEIKVGFFPPPAPGPRPVGGPIRTPLRRGGVQLKVDQEAMFFLKKHPSKDVYMVQAPYEVAVKTGNANFAKEVDAVKKYAKVLARPMDGLKSKDADKRFQTAALLLVRYRTPALGLAKTEQISAEQSKLILTALAGADWKKPNVQAPTLNPQALFFRLGLTVRDGWTPPKDFRNFPDEARKWLKDNAGKYRINRFVHPEKAEPSSGK